MSNYLLNILEKISLTKIFSHSSENCFTVFQFEEKKNTFSGNCFTVFQFDVKKTLLDEFLMLVPKVFLPLVFSSQSVKVYS